MKNKELARTLKFVLFSASAGIIELGAFSLFNDLLPTKWPGLNEGFAITLGDFFGRFSGPHTIHWATVSYLIALILSVLWNFTFNRKFTFQSAENVGKAMFLVFLFYVPFAPLSTLNENFLVGKGWPDYVVTGINMAFNLSLEYLWDNFVVYRNSKDTNERAQRKAAEEAAKTAEENQQ